MAHHAQAECIYNGGVEHFGLSSGYLGVDDRVARLLAHRKNRKQYHVDTELIIIEAGALALPEDPDSDKIELLNA